MEQQLALKLERGPVFCVFFLIVSTDNLMLSADAIRLSADTIRLLTDKGVLAIRFREPDEQKELLLQLCLGERGRCGAECLRKDEQQKEEKKRMSTTDNLLGAGIRFWRIVL